MSEHKYQLILHKVPKKEKAKMAELIISIATSYGYTIEKVQELIEETPCFLSLHENEEEALFFAKKIQKHAAEVQIQEYHVAPGKRLSNEHISGEIDLDMDDFDVKEETELAMLGQLPEDELDTNKIQVKADDLEDLELELEDDDEEAAETEETETEDVEKVEETEVAKES